MAETGMTYSAAGVNIDEAERALGAVIPAIRATYGPRVIGGIGGFGGLFQAQFDGMERPILVSSIDGVGTKTKVAAMLGDFRSLGTDIVHHCANDILCQGAAPLFFMDYFGCSKLESDALMGVIQSAATACGELDCALIGGETAEMPGVYHDGEVDVVGAMVGVVDEAHRLPRGKMQAGDVVIGLASNGLHTNGYSLARRALFEAGSLSVHDPVPGLGTTLGEELLRPHKSYFASVHPLILEGVAIKAVAHITGGGLGGNMVRVMPSDVQAVLDRRTWTPLPIFNLIQEAGNVAEQEMFRVFNMGIGMVLIVDRDFAPAIVQRLSQAGEMAGIIGEIQRGSQDVQIV
ncbi:MAG TPA: phosphoribosylformylglycinamidine cyclo-ligase [Fimbriimonadaceae bacterium]|nr:phosphoribosylformylglycinamidine cyclo-ligase [Fimbriimonadaceae bacterium]HRJ33558.1 phosphoribosylformylglycinamidine cyclo-ligase [Fimbriimonadaceae bacterium]